jgi:adenylosuccinate synthase
MTEEYGQQSAEQQYFSDVNTRLRDIEEKQRLLKDRLLLVGKNMVEDRESMFNELQELKKLTINLKEDNIRIQSFLKNMAAQTSDMARKEELLILQRQFDLFRK